MIDSKIFANLRNFKKVTEDDLYFIEFLIKERHFHKSTTKTNLTNICKVMKKDWTKETGELDREHKRQIKDKVETLLVFARKQNMVKEYTIDQDGAVVINYPLEKDPILLTNDMEP